MVVERGSISIASRPAITPSVSAMPSLRSMEGGQGMTNIARPSNISQFPGARSLSSETAISGNNALQLAPQRETRPRLSLVPNTSMVREHSIKGISRPSAISKSNILPFRSREANRGIDIVGNNAVMTAPEKHVRPAFSPDGAKTFTSQGAFKRPNETKATFDFSRYGRSIGEKGKAQTLSDGNFNKQFSFGRETTNLSKKAIVNTVGEKQTVQNHVQEQINNYPANVLPFRTMDRGEGKRTKSTDIDNIIQFRRREQIPVVAEKRTYPLGRNPQLKTEITTKPIAEVADQKQEVALQRINNLLQEINQPIKEKKGEIKMMTPIVRPNETKVKIQNVLAELQQVAKTNAKTETFMNPAKEKAVQVSPNAAQQIKPGLATLAEKVYKKEQAVLKDPVKQPLPDLFRFLKKKKKKEEEALPLHDETVNINRVNMLSEAAYAAQKHAKGGEITTKDVLKFVPYKKAPLPYHLVSSIRRNPGLSKHAEDDGSHFDLLEHVSKQKSWKGHAINFRSLVESSVNLYTAVKLGKPGHEPIAADEDVKRVMEDKGHLFAQTSGLSLKNVA